MKRSSSSSSAEMQCHSEAAGRPYLPSLSNDLCTYAPVVAADQVLVGNIVFCQIPNNMYFHAHLVFKKSLTEAGEVEFQIGNIKGWINGWCTLRNVYGKLVDAVR